MKEWGDRNACPDCGASRANVQHMDGHSYCFSCKTRFGEGVMQDVKIVETNSVLKTTGLLGDIPDRKISRDTAKKYNVQIKKKGDTVTHHIYQYFAEGGNHIAN